MSICGRCGRKYEYIRSKGCTKRYCGGCYITLKRQKLKRMGVEYLGGKCARCGYNKSQAALCFHHLSDKSFNFSRYGCLGWPRLKEELAKCELLCLNCHAEEHYGM